MDAPKKNEKVRKNGKNSTQIKKPRTKLLASITLIALVLGASGLGIGINTMMQGTPKQQSVESLQATILVAILAPAHGSTVFGNVTVRAIAHGCTVDHVSMLRNGTEIAQSLMFTWNTTSVMDGWWNLTAVIHDTKGNVTKDEVIVFVKNTEHDLPVVKITSPDDGDLVSDTVEIDAIIQEESAYTTQILANGTLKGTTLPLALVTTTLIDWSWYNITVRCTDKWGNKAQDSILVFVYNAPMESINPISAVARSFKMWETKVIKSFSFSFAYPSSYFVRASMWCMSNYTANAYFTIKIDGIVKFETITKTTLANAIMAYDAVITDLSPGSHTLSFEITADMFAFTLNTAGGSYDRVELRRIN